MKKNRTRGSGQLSLWKKCFRLMKLTILFMMMGLMQISASVYSQTAKLTLDMRNARVIDVLEQIEKQSEFRFAYSTALIDLERRVSVSINEKNIDETLDELFAGTGVKHVTRDRHIMLYPQELDAQNGTGVQQQNSVSGKVTDRTGAPMPGVTVVVKGTTRGTVTNADGNYTLTNIAEGTTLVYSFVGMRTQELIVGSQTTLNVTLEVDAIGIEEVVAIGYGTQTKASVTGSIATAKGEDLEAIPVANTGNTLVGRMPGVVAVNESGEPGYDGSTFSIRGFGEPLIIVDGVERDFTQIDPKEIENITVLKDGSAAIYGARAGNGVILVTTKRGKNEKPKFNFSANYGLQKPTTFPNFVNAVEYMTLYNEAMDNGGTPQNKYSNEVIEKTRNKEPGYYDTNWYDATFSDFSPIQSYNLNTTGGTERIRYFLSTGYLDQVGMPKTGDTWFKRYNVRSNVDVQITDNFNIGFDLSARIEQRHYPGTSFVHIMEGLFASQPMFPAEFPNPSYRPTNGKGGAPTNATNADLIGYDIDNRYIYNGTLLLDYNIPFLKGLSTKGLFNYNNRFKRDKNWRNEYDFYSYDYKSDTYTLMGTGGKRSLTKTATFDQDYTIQLSLNYEGIFDEKHKVKGLLLYEALKNSGDYLTAYREAYISSAVEELFAGGDENKNNYGNQWQGGRLAYVGRLNYDYEGKYLAEFTFRADASPKYNPDDQQWGYYPGFSLGWRISEESFMEKGNLTNLKLRASHAKSGRDDGIYYNYLSGYQYGYSYVLGSPKVVHKGIYDKGLTNPFLTWQEMTISNIGVDASYRNDLIYSSVDVFYRKQEGRVTTRQLSLPLSFGASLPQENLNSSDNRGFEFVLGHKNRISEFTYSVEGNVSWTREKWIHFEEPVYENEEQRERLQMSGQWTNRWFGYKALGLFQSQEEIDNWLVDQDGNGNQSLAPGDIKYLDYNGDGKLDNKDVHVIGRGGTPELIFGLNLSAKYKGFDMSMLWQGASLYNRLIEDDARVPFQNGATPLQIMLDRWTPETPDAKYPRTFYSGHPNSKVTSDYWLIDATYIRLKDIQLGYTFSQIPWGIHSARIYFSGFNLITFDNVYPYDPEWPASGVSSRGWYYPQQKAFNMGINITF